MGDHYVITGVLNVSGLGALYEAHDDKSGKLPERFVVKEEVVQPEAPDELHKLIVEARERIEVLMSLDHPAIPKVLDSLIVDDRIYLVMEFVDGKDLEDILNETKGHLPVKKVYGWAIDLCQVLIYLHNHEPGPVVFRDLKPANVMIDQTNRLRLVDYGIAGIFAKNEVYPPFGTDGYAAPEQYSGHVTPAVDIYALGATLHHLLTKRDPRLDAPFTFDKYRIEQLNPTVPWQFEDIVMHALAFDAEDRYTSASQMLEALRKIEDLIDA